MFLVYSYTHLKCDNKNYMRSCELINEINTLLLIVHTHDTMTHDPRRLEVFRTHMLTILT